VQHAGGVVLQGWDMSVGSARQLVGQLQATGAEVVVTNADQQQQAAAAAAQLPGLQKAAQRLQIPVVDMDAVIQAVLQGQLSEELQAVVDSKQQHEEEEEAGGVEQAEQQQQQRSIPRKRKSAVAAAPEQQQQQQQAGIKAGPHKKRRMGVSAAADRTPSRLGLSPQMQQQQQQQQRAGSRPAGITGGRAQGSPQQQHMPAASPGVRPAKAGQQQQQQQQIDRQVSWLQPAAGTAAAAGGTSPCAPCTSPLSCFRTHYQAFELRLPGAPARRRVVRSGDFVLIAPSPGEPDTPRVVQITSLWQETPTDGVARLLARGRRFYHPSDTMYAMAVDQVFMTEHVEERLPLAAVLDKCEVVFQAQRQQQQQQQEEDEEGVRRFTCGIFYDHLTLMLRPLTAAEVPAGR
jgi:hypothetical protein